MRIAGFETRMRATVKRRIESHLDIAAKNYLDDPVISNVDFSAPPGEPSFSEPGSISWRIFKNPVALFVGGVTAVLLELAEPRVRSGVWDFTTFRTDPVSRLKRTGMAAMITVYGPRSVSAKLIERVNRMHEKVVGMTPAGAPYVASDPELLSWVQTTASFGFMEAYSAYVAPLSDAEKDRCYAESKTTAELYGAIHSARSLGDQIDFFQTMYPKLEASNIVFEFRDIMRRAPALPQPATIAQRTLVRAAVELVPSEVREILGLDWRYGLRPFEKQIVMRMGARADRIFLPSSPPAQSCIRLGLPKNYLYPRIW